MGGLERERREGDESGPAGGVVRVAELAEEREVWRVCASRGRSYTEGVFDLCREPVERDGPTEPGEPDEPSSGAWRLVHVAD